jgi:hypothetical protein
MPDLLATPANCRVRCKSDKVWRQSERGYLTLADFGIIAALKRPVTDGFEARESAGTLFRGRDSDQPSLVRTI